VRCVRSIHRCASGLPRHAQIPTEKKRKKKGGGGGGGYLRGRLRRAPRLFTRMSRRPNWLRAKKASTLTAGERGGEEKKGRERFPRHRSSSVPLSWGKSLTTTAAPTEGEKEKKEKKRKKRHLAASSNRAVCHMRKPEEKDHPPKKKGERRGGSRCGVGGGPAAIRARGIELAKPGCSHRPCAPPRKEGREKERKRERGGRGFVRIGVLVDLPLPHLRRQRTDRLRGALSSV